MAAVDRWLGTKFKEGYPDFEVGLLDAVRSRCSKHGCCDCHRTTTGRLRTVSHLVAWVGSLCRSSWTRR